MRQELPALDAEPDGVANTSTLAPVVDVVVLVSETESVWNGKPVVEIDSPPLTPMAFPKPPISTGVIVHRWRLSPSFLVMTQSPLVVIMQWSLYCSLMRATRPSHNRAAEC